MEDPYCCDTAEQSMFTRFETPDQGPFLLAYSSLLFANLPPAKASANADETLTLVYVTHTVTITGRKLAGLLEPIQKGKAKRIYIGEKAKEAPKNPFVTTIEINPGPQEINH